MEMTLDNTIGASYLGSAAASMYVLSRLCTVRGVFTRRRLYGITLVQTYMYYLTYPNDWTFQRISVSDFGLALSQSSARSSSANEGRDSNVSPICIWRRAEFPDANPQTLGHVTFGSNNPRRVSLCHFIFWERTGVGINRLVTRFTSPTISLSADWLSLPYFRTFKVCTNLHQCITLF